MQEFKYVITDPEGIHARPAGELVKVVKPLTASVTIEKDGKSVDARRLMAIMSLGVKQGMEITVRAEGEGEEDAIAVVSDFLQKNM